VALTTGKIDAMAQADVDIAAIAGSGVRMRTLPSPEALRSVSAGYVVAFTRRWYDAHKDAAVGLLQGVVKSTIVLLENPEAAVRISYHMNPESVPAGIPFDEAVRRAVAVIKIRTPLLEKRTGDLDRWCEFSPRAWETYVDVIGLHGKADPAKFYTNELIERINDFDDAKYRSWARGLTVPEDEAEYRKWLAALKLPD
jgi:NitT/TauT family transport system substrate-binding protein